MKTKVAVGCGKRFYGEDWFHVDGEALKFNHLDSNDIYLKDIEENSLDVIYACHLINYLDRNDFGSLLNWWYSKLKVGGMLRLATPDMDTIANLLYWRKVKLREVIGPIHGLWSLNMGQISHLTSWNFEELSEVLSGYGFSEIRKYDWRKVEHSEVDDHSQAYLCPKGDKENGILISLNIECKK